MEVGEEAWHPSVSPGPTHDTGRSLIPGELPAEGAHGGVHGPSSSPLSHRATVTGGVYVPVLERGVVRGGEKGPSSLGLGTWVRAGHGSGADVGGVGCVDGGVGW